ncbi:hypothetical protein BJX64DRAFT_290545 [Aspergillus heterothallicus]
MEPYRDTGPLDCNLDIDTTSIKGKTAIITGGANGIGEGYVRGLVEAGAFVIIADINETVGTELASTLERTKFVKCDVTSWRDQLNVFEEATAFSPKRRVDIVVANAGISGVDSVFAFEEQDEPEEPVLNIVNINLIGVLYTVKLALYYFRRQHAAQAEPLQDTLLVLQGSMGGYLEAAATLQYCASNFIKTALMSDEVAHTLTSAGVNFATVDDAGRALLRLAADTKATGRSLAILPRELTPSGYVDLNLDDFPKGTPLRVMQDTALATAHRLKARNPILCLTDMVY